MKNSTITLLCTGLLLLSQGISPKNANMEAKKQLFHDTEIMHNFLQKVALPSETKTVSGKTPSVVTGSKGTALYVQPIDLETESGNAPGDQITVEILELCNQSALMRCNAQTVSDGQLLVSGGSYHIAMYSNGEKLRLKEGKSLKADLPASSKDAEMSIFYGQKTSDGINWKPSGQKLGMPVQGIKGIQNPVDNLDNDNNVNYIPNNTNVNNWNLNINQNKNVNVLTDEISKEYQAQTKALQPVYQAVALANLGWINVDKFYKEGNLVSMNLEFPEDCKIARVFVAFKAMNSVLSYCYHSTNEKTLAIGSVPEGKPVRIIVVESRDGKTYAYKKDVNISKDAQHKVAPVLCSETEIQKLFVM